MAPYIDSLMDGVTLVCGGCGYGAKCSDEIGRIGARDYLILQNYFARQYVAENLG